MTDDAPIALTFWLLLALFGTGLAAGFVDAIAGGGGLITLPVILSLGLPPPIALGVNKLQATFGSGSAAWHYRKSELVSVRDCLPGVLFTLLGAAAGTYCVQLLDTRYLKQLIPILLLGVLAYVVFKPQLGTEDIRPRLARGPFYVLAGLGLGFYDGFLGPGTGSFWTMAFMLGLGFNLTKATGYTKVMNFTSNLTALAGFLLAGKVVFPAGLVMGVGQLLGARFGSQLVVARGTRFIRPVFITMVLAVLLKLLYETARRH